MMRDFIDIITESLKKPQEITDFKTRYSDPKINTRVQQQAARKNPEWKRSLVKVMKSFGFALIGAGVNATVFRNPKYPYVLKVYRTDEGFDEWLYFIHTNRDNVYVPKVRGQRIRLNKIFSAIRMEPLEPCAAEAANRLVDRIEAVKETLNMKRRVDDSDADLLKIAKFMRDWETHGDLSPHNIMQRNNGELVIIDPLYVDPSLKYDFINIIKENAPQISDMSRFQNLSSDVLRGYTTGYDNGFSATDYPPACRSSADYNWHFDPVYLIGKIQHAGQYGAMLNDHIEAWAEDGDPTYYDDLSNEPLQDPIVVVEIDSVGYIWDGTHRVGAFENMDLLTIPAVVGVPK